MPLPIIYLTAGTRTSSAGATGATPALPGSRVNGNLLIALIGVKNNETHSWPAAWNKVTQVNSGTGWSVSWGWRWVDGAEAAPAVTWTSSVANFGHVFQLAHWGPGGRNPIGATNSGTGTASTHACTAVTTTGVASTVIYLDGSAANTALGTPSGWTERLDSAGATGATRDIIGEKYVAASGSSSGNISVTGAAAAWVMFQIEILAYLPSKGTASTPGDMPEVAPRSGQGIAPNVPPGLASERGHPGPGLRALQRFRDRSLRDRPGAFIPEPEVGIVPTKGALVLTGRVPTFTQPQSAQPTKGALVLTGYAPTLEQDQTLAPTKGALVLTGQVPTLVQPQTLQPTKGGLVLTGKQPGVVVLCEVQVSWIAFEVPESTATTLTPIKGAMVLTGRQPTIAQHQTLAPTSATLVLTGKVATLVQHQSLVATVGHLVATGYAPGVERTAHQTLAPPKGALVLAGKTPVLDQSLAPTKGALVLAGKTPVLDQDRDYTPTKGALVLTGQQPVVQQGDSVTYLPTKGALVLAGKTPVLEQDRDYTPTKGALTLTGQTPTLEQDRVITLTPVDGPYLILAGKQPVIQQGASVTFTPTKGALALGGKQPTLTQPRSVQPGAGALALGGKQPVIQQGASVTFTPTKGALVLTGQTPALGQSQSFTPTKGALVLAGKTPVLEQNQLFAPTKGALVLTGQTPALEQDRDYTPTKGALVLTGRQPAVGSSGLLPVTGSLLLTPHNPQLYWGDPVAPRSSVLRLFGFTPTVTQARTYAPVRGSLAVTGYQSTLTQPRNIGAPVRGQVALRGFPVGLVQSREFAPVPATLLLTGYTPILAQSRYVAPVVGHAVFTGYAPDLVQRPPTPSANQGILYRAARVSGNVSYTQAVMWPYAAATAASVLDGVVGAAVGGGHATYVGVTGHALLTGYVPAIKVAGAGGWAAPVGVFYRATYINSDIVYAAAWRLFAEEAVASATLDGVYGGAQVTIQLPFTGPIIYSANRISGNATYGATRVWATSFGAWEIPAPIFEGVGTSSSEGSGAGTLREQRMSASGRVTDGSIAGLASAVLSGVTGAALGSLASSGSGAAALRPHQLSATGRISGNSIGGWATATLAGVAGAAVAHNNNVTGYAMLDGVTGTAQGSHEVVSVAAGTLAGVVGSARGQLFPVGSVTPIPPFNVTVELAEWEITASVSDLVCQAQPQAELLLSGDTDEIVANWE